MTDRGSQFKFLTAAQAHQQATALHGTAYTGERTEPTAGNPVEVNDPRPEANAETTLTETRVNKRATRKTVETVEGTGRKGGPKLKRVTKVGLGENPQGSGRAPRMGALAESMVVDHEGNPIKRMDKAEGSDNSLLKAYDDAGYKGENESPTDKAQTMADFVTAKKTMKGKGRIPKDFQTPTVNAPENGVRYADREELVDSLKDGSIRYSKQSKDKDGLPSVARGAFAGLSARQIASDPDLRRLARIANGTHTEADLVHVQLHGMPKNIPTVDQPRGSKLPTEATKVGEGESLFEHIKKNGVMNPVTVDFSSGTPKIVDGLKRIAAAHAIDPEMKIPYKEA